MGGGCSHLTTGNTRQHLTGATAFLRRLIYNGVRMHHVYEGVRGQRVREGEDYRGERFGPE